MRAKIIACETVGEEMKPFIPPDMPYKFLEFGLHVAPARLNAALQREIDETPRDLDTILIGYGMCSRGAVGLEARSFTLVIPRFDDCIGLFLGSQAEYRRQCIKAPGTFYLTKGWIKCGDDPYTEYLKMKEKYGHDKAYWLEKKVIENYTRLVLIDTGSADLTSSRVYVRKVAQFFDLAVEEIPGSDRLVKKLIAGEWDENFVIVPPGGRVEAYMFNSF